MVTGSLALNKTKRNRCHESLETEECNLVDTPDTACRLLCPGGLWQAHKQAAMDCVIQKLGVSGKVLFGRRRTGAFWCDRPSNPPAGWICSCWADRPNDRRRCHPSAHRRGLAGIEAAHCYCLPRASCLSAPT